MLYAERGYEVHLIVDGVSSQYLTDRAVGLQVCGSNVPPLKPFQMNKCRLASFACAIPFSKTAIQDHKIFLCSCAEFSEA